MDKSFMLIFGSLIKSQVIARKNSVFVCVHSSILGSEIDADEQAIMFIANTTYMAEPQAHQAAAIFEAQLPPIDARVDEIVPLVGTARLIIGPDNPIEFFGYQVDYKQKDGQWRPTDGRHNLPVFNDHLADWNTYGLATGPYDLRLSLYHSYGDSIAMDSYAYLSLNTSVKNLPMPKTTRLLHNSPNPFNPTTTIGYELAAATQVRLVIYNSIGQIVQTEVNEVQSAGWYTVHIDASNWPAGSYFYRLQTDDITDVKRMLLVK